MLNIIYEDNHLLVLEKPINLPMQKDASNDLDLLTLAKSYLVNKYQKSGQAYLGLVQRLDRPVGGIVVLAKTSKAAARLSKALLNQEVKKTYLAVVRDNNLPAQGHLVDRLLKDHQHNRVKVDKRGKEAILDYCVLKRKAPWALVKIALKTGRSHQIRVQFAARNHPLYGDQRYNKDAESGEQIALWSYALEFTHPTKGEILRFKLDPPPIYPFNI